LAMNGTSRQNSFAFGSGSLAFNGANSVQLSTLLKMSRWNSVEAIFKRDSFVEGGVGRAIFFKR
jgi:hypothetical protein